jgi:hypothetical protein
MTRCVACQAPDCAHTDAVYAGMSPAAVLIDCGGCAPPVLLAPRDHGERASGVSVPFHREVK